MTIDELLTDARKRLRRLEPSQAHQAVQAGAILVDTRPEYQRRADGQVPGAIVIERNHLEWRLDPTSPSKIPLAASHDNTWIICCNEGYSSSLTAAALHALGLHQATDVIGGLQAWRAASLPVSSPDNQRKKSLSSGSGKFSAVVVAGVLTWGSCYGWRWCAPTAAGGRLPGPD